MGTPLTVIAKSQLKPIWRGRQIEKEKERGRRSGNKEMQSVTESNKQ